VQIEVLHPPAKGVFGSDNANSLVLLVEYAGRRLLLPGDLESPGLEDLLAEEPLDCDIIMAPHHGSVRSDPTGFALWSRPEFVVVSGSHEFEERGSVFVVKDSYRARGAEVFHTAEVGAVRFELNADGIRAIPFRQ
jgi:competence protein ComEC